MQQPVVPCARDKEDQADKEVSRYHVRYVKRSEQRYANYWRKLSGLKSRGRSLACRAKLHCSVLGVAMLTCTTPHLDGYANNGERPLSWNGKGRMLVCSCWWAYCGFIT
jgi:hypothetical protein